MTAAVDWDGWTPEIEATLLFVVADDRVLLIHKKRGLGAGKLNGPGGKVDPGETPLDAAEREFEEEVRARPRGTHKAGELWFHVLSGPAIRIHVFRASGVDRAPSETDEARPMWVAVDEVPFGRMWEDDRYWFPRLLAGQPFQARTVFEGDRLREFEWAEPGWADLPGSAGRRSVVG